MKRIFNILLICFTLLLNSNLAFAYSNQPQLNVENYINIVNLNEQNKQEVILDVFKKTEAFMRTQVNATLKSPIQIIFTYKENTQCYQQGNSIYVSWYSSSISGESDLQWFRHMIAHEMVHVYQYQLAGDDVNLAWMNEGTANVISDMIMKQYYNYDKGFSKQSATTYLQGVGSFPSIKKLKSHDQWNSVAKQNNYSEHMAYKYATIIAYDLADINGLPSLMNYYKQYSRSHSIYSAFYDTYKVYYMDFEDYVDGAMAYNYHLRMADF